MIQKISAEEAAMKVKSGQTVIVSGNGEMLLPDDLLAALEKRFLETGEPRDLTLIYNVIPGAQRSGTGIDRFAHPGMVKRIYAGAYFTLRVDKLNELIKNNQVEAYLIPYGALYNMVRAGSAGHPGILTSVGLGTFVDPRNGKYRLTARTTEDIVRVMTIDGKEYLYWKALSADVALIRATTSDEEGNLSIEQEPNSIGLLHQAMLAKNNGGIVIAQVKQISKPFSVHPKLITVPGIFVDYAVVAPNQMDAMPYNPAWTGDIQVPVDELQPIPLDYRKVIARRAAMELRPGDLVNFGFGLPSDVPAIAGEEGISEKLIFNVEHGPIGGIPNNKEAFGAGVNMTAIMDGPDISDLFDGGRLDMTCLGMAEVDPNGSVNVSCVNGRFNLGGFMDIVHATKRIVFCGTFTAKGLKAEVKDGRLHILQEGKFVKFIPSFDYVSFNGKAAFAKGQQVTYVTERAVFSLTEKGLTLIEIAPGIDLEKDVLSLMAFRPHISESLKEMDARIFKPEKMGLAHDFAK
ncbi:MAG TPA: CoA-transferase [Bacilli bacterium]